MTNEEIIQRGQLINDETEPAQNTSERVGGVIKGIGQNLADKDTAIAAEAARNGYYQCTVSDTTLAVTAPGFTLPAHGGNIRIKMSAPATGACTLNINGTGPKALLYNGAAVSSANTWEKDEIISVFYDPSGSGQYFASNSQGGGGKAQKIKYDNSQSGLAATDVQGAIDAVNENTIVESDITNSLSSYESRGGYLTASLGWTSNTNCNTVFIPCAKGDSFKLLCTTVNYYAILSAIPNTAATGFGSSRKTLSASSTPHIINITQDDAAYLAIRADGSSGNTFAPASIIKINPIKSEINNIQDDIDEINERTLISADITALSGYERRNGYLTASLGWDTNTGIYTTFIPCIKGDIFKLVCSASTNYYAILKAIPNTGATGFTSRIQIPQSSNPYTIEITQDDAAYLAIRTDNSSGGNAFAPTSIIRYSQLKERVNANTENIEALRSDISKNYANIGSRSKIALPAPITLRGWIHNTRLTWADKSNTYFSIIPVVAGKRMHWVYNGGSSSFHYAWLTDFNMIGQKIVTAGGTPAFVSGTTLNWTGVIDNDNIIVPETAKYLYVLHSYETSGGVANRLPSMYWIDMAGDMEVNDVYAKVRGKRISFLGDSITSYYNMPYVGAGDIWAYPNFGDRGVMSPQQCWWGRLVERTGMILLRNASWKGSTCCGNSLDSSWKTGCSDARIALLTDGTYQPDIIMVFIGINDWIQDKVLGTFDPRALIPADGTLNVFVDAYMKMIAKIQATYTKARIFCCTLMATAHDTHDVDQIYPDINDNGVSLYEFNQVIRQICDAMGVDVIELSRCGLHFDNLSYYADADLIHPNSYGMELMANKAEAELLAKY